MTPLKIAILGAGSSYTPELVEGLAANKENFPVSELVFMDIDPRRLEIMTGFCKRFLQRLRYPIPIVSTTDMQQALEGADFVIVQIRVGGNQQRTLDEKIPLKYGLIGQETTGPGGMLKAFRTIPVVLEIARLVEKNNPDAWIINYTNPTGMITEAVTRDTGAKIVGLCSYGFYPKWCTNIALGAPEEEITYSYVGLNHLNFAYDIKISGRPISPEEFDQVASINRWSTIQPDLTKTLRLIPSPYLQYYYHTDRLVQDLKSQPLSRGEAVQLVEQELFASYADPTCNTKPEALKMRGSGYGGYSEVAIGVMEALSSNREKWMIVNVPNRGALHWLPENAVVEIPCLINAGGIAPLNIPDTPPAVWGILAAVKNYEQLAVEAAITGSRDLALLALLAHPLVRQYDIAKPLLDEMLTANRDFLPQFFR